MTDTPATSSIPEVTPPTIDLATDELTTLNQFLEYYRSELLGRAAGLSSEQLNQRVAASTLTLGGLVKHMASVEHTWFDYRFRGDEPGEPWLSAPWDDDADWEFTSAADDSPTELLRLFTAACESSRAIAEAAESLDQLSVRSMDGTHWNLRWIMVHMIEEYARHVGHADIIREAIDGVAG